MNPLVTLLLFLPFVFTTLVNRTIDDTLGDAVTGTVPVYGGNDNIFSWNACTASDCTSSPGYGGYPVDPNKVINGTWHDSIAKQGGDTKTITLNFVGKSASLTDDDVPNITINI